MNHEERLNACKSCSLSRKSTLAGKSVTTCGELNLFHIPPVIGGVVEYDGRNVNLCGCVMEVKTLLSVATCPIDRWNESNTNLAI